MSVEILNILLGHAMIFSAAMIAVSWLNCKLSRDISKLWNPEDFKDALNQVQARLMSEQWDVDQHRQFSRACMWVAVLAILTSAMVGINKEAKKQKLEAEKTEARDDKN